MQRSLWELCQRNSSTGTYDLSNHKSERKGQVSNKAGPRMRAFQVKL